MFEIYKDLGKIILRERKKHTGGFMEHLLLVLRPRKVQRLPLHAFLKIMGHILKNKQKNKCVCVHDIVRLIIMKTKMKLKKDHIDTT